MKVVLVSKPQAKNAGKRLTHSNHLLVRLKLTTEPELTKYLEVVAHRTEVLRDEDWLVSPTACFGRITCFTLNRRRTLNVSLRTCFFTVDEHWDGLVNSGACWLDVDLINSFHWSFDDWSCSLFTITVTRLILSAVICFIRGFLPCRFKNKTLDVEFANG